MQDTTNPTLAAIAEQLEALGVYCVGDDHAFFGRRWPQDEPSGIWIAADHTTEAFASKLAEVGPIVAKHGWLERYDSETAVLWVTTAR